MNVLGFDSFYALLLALHPYKVGIMWVYIKFVQLLFACTELYTVKKLANKKNEHAAEFSVVE